MEKKSPGKYPNLLIPEKSGLCSVQSVEDPQESNSISSRYNPYFRKNNESIDFTQKALRLPPIVTTSSQQCSSETYKRRITPSNNQDCSPFSIEDKRLETYSDLSLLLEKYKNDSKLLKISLSKKIDEDRRKTEEAKLKYDYLDYLISLDSADSISSLTTKVTQQVTAAGSLDKSTANHYSLFNARNLSSKKSEEESSNSYYNNFKSDRMTKQDNSKVMDVEPRYDRRTCIEYAYSGITPHQSDSNGASKINQRDSTYQLYSPYEIQNKRSRAPKYLNYQHQLTKKGISDNSQVTPKPSLIRKNSDPIRLNNCSNSKLIPASDVSSSLSLRARKFSRHLSIPDLQNPNSSAMPNSKTFATLSIPVSVGSSSRISASSSTTSELSSQSSVYNSKSDYGTVDNAGREKLSDSKDKRELYRSLNTQDDTIDIDQQPLYSLTHTKKERALLPRIGVSQDPYYDIPTRSTNQLSAVPVNSQKDQSPSDYPRSKGKKREMHAITMIVETTDFPYHDYFIWKNNGNTIHKNSGQKSIYYKCSNSMEGCPVNKTVMFKEDGSYLIKYRGKHIDKCNNEKAARTPS